MKNRGEFHAAVATKRAHLPVSHVRRSSNSILVFLFFRHSPVPQIMTVAHTASAEATK